MCKSEIFNRVLDVVSQQTEVSREQILSRSKSMEVVDARCILFRLLQEQGLYPGQIATQARKTPAAIRYLLSQVEQIKTGANDLFGWIGEHKGDIIEGWNFLQMIRGGAPLPLASAPPIDIPPIPDNQ